MPVAPEAPPAPKPVAAVARPLSPHLQVYRPQLTSVLSITHRGTGVALAVGTLLLVWWLVAAASGPEQFALAQSFLGTLLGKLLLLGWTIALFYHLANGIRHLFWDAGFGYEKADARAASIAVVAISIALTVAAFGAGCIVKGAA